MSVRAGREFLATPGPTTIPDAMHRPAVNMYSGPLIALTDSLLQDLGRLFGTAHGPISTSRTDMERGKAALVILPVS
jgi:hypothetical protein